MMIISLNESEWYELQPFFTRVAQLLGWNPQVTRFVAMEANKEIATYALPVPEPQLLIGLAQTQTEHNFVNLSVRASLF